MRLISLFNRSLPDNALHLESPYFVTPRIINARIYCDGYGNYHCYTKKELIINRLKYLKSTCCYIMRNIFRRKHV